jgi:hypothetical protein
MSMAEGHKQGNGVEMPQGNCSCLNLQRVCSVFLGPSLRGWVSVCVWWGNNSCWAGVPVGSSEEPGPAAHRAGVWFPTGCRWGLLGLPWGCHSGGKVRSGPGSYLSLRFGLMFSSLLLWQNISRLNRKVGCCKKDKIKETKESFSSTLKLCYWMAKAHTSHVHHGPVYKADQGHLSQLEMWFCGGAPT